MQRLLWLFLLAGCPSSSRYVVADVTVAHVPVQGAMVAADCGNDRAARRTDEDGRARVPILSSTSRDCSLVVAKPGLPTVEVAPVSSCPTATACPPTRIDLAPSVQANPYARNPMEVAQ
jgi:hypothetical protein